MGSSKQSCMFWKSHHFLMKTFSIPLDFMLLRGIIILLVFVEQKGQVL